METNKICETPLLRDRHNAAFALSVLQANTNISNLWIFKNYFPLKFEGEVFIDQPFFLLSGLFTFRFILYHPLCNVKRAFTRALKKGYYIYSETNERYIPRRPAYMNYNFLHDLLVFGCENDAFLSIGYGEPGTYAVDTIPFSEMSLAIKHCSSRYKLKIMKFKIKNSYRLSEPSTNDIIKTIDTYLHPTEARRGGFAIRLLLKKLQSANTSIRFSFQESRCVLEHCQLLHSLRNNFMFVDEKQLLYDEVLKLGELFFVLAKKYKVRVEKGVETISTHGRLVKTLYDLIQTEEKLLTDILNLLCAKD